MGRVFDDNGLNFIDSTEGLIQLCNDWIDPGMVMAEIGCFRGVSTGIFAGFAKTVYAIDAWLSQSGYTEIPRDLMEKAEPLFDKVMQEHPNIIKMKGMSVDMARNFEDETLDLIYIDADHREPAIRADLSAWVPKVKKGGFVAGHDYCMVGSLVPAVTVYPEQSWIYRK